MVDTLSRNPGFVLYFVRSFIDRRAADHGSELSRGWMHEITGRSLRKRQSPGEGAVDWLPEGRDVLCMRGLHQ
jgi:hypothetical protein